MRYSIQYQETTGEWTIFDTGGGSGLVGICRTEEDAMLEALKLEEKSRVSGHYQFDNDRLDGAPTTQLHALKFEAQGKLEAEQPAENQTKQAIQKAQADQASPDNKPDHRGQIVDVTA